MIRSATDLRLWRARRIRREDRIKGLGAAVQLPLLLGTAPKPYTDTTLNPRLSDTRMFCSGPQASLPGPHLMAYLEMPSAT